MATEIRVLWIEPTDRQKLWLRRYIYSEERKCKANGSYCDAMVPFGEAPVAYDADGYIKSVDEQKPHWNDPRWPTACDACKEPFGERGNYQLFTDQIYRAPETGQEFARREAPVGACWDAWWISERRKDGPTGCGYMVGPDHRSLVVRLPGNHDWMIDSRCSNCTRKDDMTHFCWVRHGRPEDGTLHVDKNGNTCSAGAGSIAVPGFHGFLHNHVLKSC